MATAAPRPFAIPGRRWIPRAAAPADVAQVRALTGALRLPDPLCRLLVQRGLAGDADARAFLRPRLDGRPDPFLMAGMEEAVGRIEDALSRGETILVHGDYDVDGMCATALFTRALRHLGGRVEPFAPHRVRDGYDLGRAGVEAAAKSGAGLLLTADCGILAHQAVRDAASAGIDVVITDHHTVGATLPEAVAVVNPNRPDCAYPQKGLAGTGVAFKVCQALFSRRGAEPEWLDWHLDLVALATVADLVPLEGENRLLVHYGLKVLAETRNRGLAALGRVSGLEGKTLASGHLSHMMGPRLNAIGRLDDAAWGVRLLLTESEEEATSIAERLDRTNQRRQELDRETLGEALALLERDGDPDRDWGVVLAGDGWHPGVIGIVASRVVERIHRPVILVSLGAGGGPGRGSGRSIPGFDLVGALHACGEHLVRFGGHKQAAGLDIRPESLPAFREAFAAVARERLTEDALLPATPFDLELTLREANRDLARYLPYLGPFGMGNPTPVFVARGVELDGPARIVGREHLRLDLVQDGARLGGIAFRMAERAPEIAAADRLDVAFKLELDAWRGRERLQAKVVDLRPSGVRP